ncbi:hypothetical protein A2625_02360 [candidate division WOR-1 bacterium RIFCSPHIGHO2_01_FULL_53_15]|uniref:Outer membrane protein beta-barrel domain-containing protein n=1 Tax=candidate division WOR-1 bacterium RIFCSPHIGHO2_01_FULL_53_15 TaxID=1802564 RepID=A0A1F4PZW8_UNCSA|nr:MAG: hypothetical protein A2625_02360 [candidate division WOR-1 bacterium RIFCSPHIGHO2_01_FULL_53_15]OGC10808.1 MAG: hypothetical protein A3D23_05440 [candidate division WOR-1 bacterium RIFCSPHIGHO2_02_FULL_53_26]
MKKIALMLIAVVLVSSGAFAAGNLAVGTTLGFASLKYQFSPDVTGSLGLNNFSGAATGTGILVKVDYNLAKAGNVQPNIGLYYTTNGAAAATTILGITWGVTAMVESNLSLGADIILVNQSTLAGANTTGLLPGIALAAAYTL